MNDAILLLEVTKDYQLSPFRKKRGLDSFTLAVSDGQILGMIGPNGAGKSTTFKLILGFIKPTRGQIFIFGKEPSTSTRKKIGYVPENPRFPGFLTAFQVLKYYGELSGVRGKTLRERSQQLLELVKLSNVSKERVKGFSKGMTQRLAIAQALICKPDILILDEPMSGLDPLARIELREMIKKIHAQSPQTTILLSTHILSDAETLCTHLAIINQGKLIRHAPIQDFYQDHSQVFELTVRSSEKALRLELQHHWKAKDSPSGLSVTVSGLEQLETLLKTIRDGGADVAALWSRKPELEKVIYKNELSESTSSTEDLVSSC